MKGYDRPVRVCESCHTLFYPNSGSPENIQGTLEGGAVVAQVHAKHPVPYPNQNYKLIPNDLSHNLSVRSEFYYERTPNTALCLSLADLLEKKREAAGVILDCCHTVSAQLIPDSQGRVNEEIDHHFVIRYAVVLSVEEICYLF